MDVRGKEIFIERYTAVSPQGYIGDYIHNRAGSDTELAIHNLYSDGF